MTVRHLSKLPERQRPRTKIPDSLYPALDCVFPPWRKVSRRQLARVALLKCQGKIRHALDAVRFPCLSVRCAVPPGPRFRPRRIIAAGSRSSLCTLPPTMQRRVLDMLSCVRFEIRRTSTTAKALPAYIPVCCVCGCKSHGSVLGDYGRCSMLGWWVLLKVALCAVAACSD